MTWKKGMDCCIYQRGHSIETLPLLLSHEHVDFLLDTYYITEERCDITWIMVEREGQKVTFIESRLIFKHCAWHSECCHIWSQKSLKRFVLLTPFSSFNWGSLPLFVWATTKYHRLLLYTTEMHFSQFWRLRVWGPVPAEFTEVPLPRCRLLSVCTWWNGEGLFLEGH